MVDTISVLATHLTEIIKNMPMKYLADRMYKTCWITPRKPALLLLMNYIQNCSIWVKFRKVLGNLLEEGVAIRDLVTILEALSDAARVTKVPELLTEYAPIDGKADCCSLFVDYKLFV